MVKVDIHNPGKAPRVIHGFSGRDDKGTEIHDTPISILPGHTAKDAEISESEVARLKKLADESPPNTELLIKETGRVDPAGRRDTDDGDDGKSKPGARK